LGLALSFLVSFKSTLKKIREATRELKRYNKETKIDMKELKRQATLMLTYFQHPEEFNSDLEDDIAETIMAIQTMNEFERNQVGPSSESSRSMKYLQMRMLISTTTGGRIEQALETNQDTLRRRLDQLLKKTKQDRSVWLNDDDSPTDHYYDAERKLPFTDLHRLARAIWSTLAQRKLEFQRMKGSSLIGTFLFFVY